MGAGILCGKSQIAPPPKNKFKYTVNYPADNNIGAVGAEYFANS